MTELALNLNGTSGRRVPLGYPSALDLVLDITGTTSDRCSASRCRRGAEVGAHVKFYNGDHRHHVVPMCIGHNNQRGQVVEIRENSPRVLANERHLIRELDGDPDYTPLEKIVLFAGAALAGYALWQILKPKPTPPPQAVYPPAQPWTQPVAPPVRWP